MLERILHGAMHLASALSAVMACVAAWYGDYAFAACNIGFATYFRLAVRA